MADNVVSNIGVGGATWVTAQGTWSGDSAQLAGAFAIIVSGSEGSWSFTQVVGGAGVVEAGVQRVTLASNDPAVTLLGTIDADTSKIVACDTGAVVIASGTLTGITNAVAVTGTFWQATQPVSGTFWQATQPVSGTFWQETQPVSLASVPSHAVTNAGTFAVQVTGDALTALQLIDNAVSGAGFNVTQFAGAAVPIGAGLEATALRVTLATDSTGLISIDDNGGSITVDGTVAVTGTFWQATQPVSGTFWQATQPVSLASVPSHAVTNVGTFAVQVTGDALTALQLIDNAVSGAGFNITQFGGAAVPIGAGTEAAAVRVTIATDSTGVLSIDDNGGALTVDGTVTANLSATDNAVLDTIDAVLDAINAKLVTGTVIGDVNLGATDNAVLDAIAASLNTLDNCISGSEAQVDVVTQPARDRLTDNVGVALQTDVILSDTSALTPKFAVIDTAATPDTTLVAAVADKKIRVLALSAIAAGDVTARFESGTGGTALTGQMTLTHSSGFTLPFNPVGWFETAVNTLLNLELSAAISVDGCLTYVEV